MWPQRMEARSRSGSGAFPAAASQRCRPPCSPSSAKRFSISSIWSTAVLRYASASARNSSSGLKVRGREW